MDHKGILAVLLKYGLLSGLAVWLVYFGATDILSSVKRNGDETAALTRVMEKHIEASLRVEQTLLRLERIDERIESVQRQQCVNAAKNYPQWQACWSAGDK